MNNHIFKVALINGTWLVSGGQDGAFQDTFYTHSYKISLYSSIETIHLGNNVIPTTFRTSIHAIGKNIEWSLQLNN